MKLACLHAHYSNISYIEQSLSKDNLELVHFVDPGLMDRLTNDKSFQKLDAQKKVKDQLEWIANSNVDAILITCTNYIALLNEDELSISIPIIKIDEPFFEAICNIETPQAIVFSNPATVEGTMTRLNQYAKSNAKTIDVEVFIVENSFDLFMNGLQEEYNQAIAEYLNKMLMEEDKVISVAQLSMVHASQQVERTSLKKIINPLQTLSSYMYDNQKRKAVD